MNVDGLSIIYSIPRLDSQNASIPNLVLDRYVGVVSAL